MGSEPIVQIVTHFMRRGYKVEQEDTFFVVATDDDEIEFLLFYFYEYIQIVYVFPINEKAKNDRFDTLERLNVFNEVALISRANFVDEDNISISAFFPNFYEPELFATFFDTYLNDLAIMYGDKFNIFDLLPDEEE
jgi:hypothetical protein